MEWIKKGDELNVAVREYNQRNRGMRVKCQGKTGMPTQADGNADLQDMGWSHWAQFDAAQRDKMYHDCLTVIVREG